LPVWLGISQSRDAHCYRKHRKCIPLVKLLVEWEKVAPGDEKGEKDLAILVILKRTGWNEAGRVNRPITLLIR
jgi:hypothetical protein